jgi:hypothetical protein
MTDRIKALTVVLVPNMRDDDVEPIINAIRLLTGVIDVRSHVADLDHVSAVAQAKYELRKRLHDVFWEG